MGRGQVVRHQVLVLAFGGSNPSVPANIAPKENFVAKDMISRDDIVSYREMCDIENVQTLQRGMNFNI